jgi:hypothetical protein
LAVCVENAILMVFISLCLAHDGGYTIGQTGERRRRENIGVPLGPLERRAARAPANLGEPCSAPCTKGRAIRSSTAVRLMQKPSDAPGGRGVAGGGCKVGLMVVGR